MSKKRMAPESLSLVRHRAPRVAASGNDRYALLTEPGLERKDEARLHIVVGRRPTEGTPTEGLTLVGPHEAVFPVAEGAPVTAGIWADAQGRLRLAFCDGHCVRATRSRAPISSLEALADVNAWEAVSSVKPSPDQQVHLGDGALLPDGRLALALLERPTGRLALVEPDGEGPWAPLHANHLNHSPALTADPQGAQLHLAWDTEDQRILLRSVDVNQWRRGIAVDGAPTLVWYHCHDPDVESDGRSLVVSYTDHLQRIKYGWHDGERWHQDEHVTTLHPRFKAQIEHGPWCWRDTEDVIHVTWVNLTRARAYESRWLGDAFSDPQPVEGLFHPSVLYDYTRVKAERISLDRRNGALTLSSTFLPERHGMYPRSDAAPRRMKPEDPLMPLDMAEFTSARNGVVVLHTMPTQPSEPVLEPTDREADFDGSRVLNNGVVLRDGGRYRMWYGGVPMTSDPDVPWYDQVYIGYAESDDGIAWRRTETGAHRAFRGEPQPHLIEGLDHNACVFIDPEDEPGRRYKAIKFETRPQRQTRVEETGELGYLGPPWYGWLATSPDGLSWRRERIEVDFPGPVPYGFTPQSALHDPRDPDPQKRYKAIGFVSMISKRRSAAMAYSPDAVHWTAGERLPELDSMAATTPVLLAGNESQIHDAALCRYGPYLLALYQHQITPAASDIRLAMSRDGEHFRFVEPETPLVAQGNASAWNSGAMVPIDMLLTDDSVVVYYGASASDAAEEYRGIPKRRSCAGRAELPRDRFVRLAPRDPDAPVTACTVPVTPGTETPSSLTVNACVSPGGALRIALTEPENPDRALPGRSLADAQPIAEDVLDGLARWSDGAAVPRDRSFCIYAELTPGAPTDGLFAFRLREGGA